MHKKIYASGFLYHTPTQQVLLQQHESSAPTWSLFSGEGQDGEDPIVIFKEIVSSQLKIKLSLKDINSIYDYFNEELSRHSHLLYALADKKKDTYTNEGYTMRWFTFKEIYKLPIDRQTRQDITVGKRVIDAITRSNEPQEEKPLHERTQ